MDFEKEIALFNDKDFRKKLRKHPKLCLQELKYDIDDNIDIIVKTNSKNTIYIILNNNVDSDIMLDGIQAAKTKLLGTVATVGTLGTVGTAGSVLTTVSSASSAGSVGSLGTLSTKGEVSINI